MEIIINNIQIITIITLLITVVNYIIIVLIKTEKKHYLVNYMTSDNSLNRHIVLTLCKEEIEDDKKIINLINNIRFHENDIKITHITRI